MGKASKETITELEGILNGATDGLSKVSTRRMFGCHALFADGSVFGLVWKEGRIGVRLPNSEMLDELMAIKGAAPWKAGKITMSHWVLVPESMHSSGASLKSWVKKSHTLALASKKKPAAKKIKKSAASKSKVGSKKK